MDSVAYHGEVWTDGRGFATVRLPAEAGPLEPPLAYELIQTDQPHIKVFWRISRRKEESQ